jgi:hypothetical protein
MAKDLGTPDYDKNPKGQTPEQAAEDTWLVQQQLEATRKRMTGLEGRKLGAAKRQEKALLKRLAKLGVSAGGVKVTAGKPTVTQADGVLSIKVPIELELVLNLKAKVNVAAEEEVGEIE